MSSAATASPFFGAYNARHINAEEVATQFVSSQKFWELIALRHSLLIGPRGSGKTHLLKMLQPKALSAWQDEEATRARETVKFWGVFTPADVNWKIQVDERASSLSEEEKRRFTNAVFLSHFRESFLTCILQLTRDRPKNDTASEKLSISIPKEKEIEFCIGLAQAWKLGRSVPSLDGLKVALVEELSHLGRSFPKSGLSEYMSQLLEMDLLGVSREIAEHFAMATGIHSARWALCFDELEIAPLQIQQDLFKYLRSTDSRFIFKLAISPSNDASSLLNSEGTASAGNDFDAIPLWFTDQREREQFCQSLWDKQSSTTKAKHIPPATLLNRSRFQYANTDTSSGSRRYSGRNGWAKDFRELERKDSSFAEYLRRNGIRSDALETTSREKMNSIVRKVAPLVGFRNAYFSNKAKDASLTPARRPIKKAPHEIFSGWEAICTATEGNPRWFSGIASRLILKWTESPSGKELSREQQTTELESSAKKFLAWINAIPVNEQDYKETQLSLIEFIHKIANHFEASALGKTFTADPILAFTVDERTPEPIQRLVMAALNIGAVVLFDDDDVHFTSSSLVGKTFRLVHLLAPHFNLPMRKGKDRRLSVILSKENGLSNAAPNNGDKVPSKPRVNQLGLFQ